VLLSIYVDDILLFGKDLGLIDKVKAALSERFDMKDFGEATSILGMDIVRDRVKGTLFLTQRRYAKEIVDKFNQQNSKPKSTPLECKTRYSKLQNAITPAEKAEMENKPYREAIGCLMYLMTCTRPDLAASVSLLSRYMESPGSAHWKGVQRVLQYVNCTQEFGILYQKQESLNLHGYCDSDWAGDLDDRKSTAGWVMMLSGGAVSWQCKKQKSPAQSSCEAEYVAGGIIASEISWLRGLFDELDISLPPTLVESDSQSAMAMALNPVFHERSKHIELKWHLLRQMVEENHIRLKYIRTDVQVADALTKSVPGPKHAYCRASMGILCRPPELAVKT
jgi:hypothetical protein